MTFRDYRKYEVYEDGRIWSYSHKKWLKPITEKNGYQVVWLSDNNGKIKKYRLHRVVYETFSGEPIPEGMQVNHIDERKDNNARNNLNLMSQKENINWGSGIQRCHKAQSKQVGAFNNNGELIMVFSSTQEAGRNGFDQGTVAACCNGKRKTHKGFKWKYIKKNS